jgi:tetratricopeptide (TPR) repeat protein
VAQQNFQKAIDGDVKADSLFNLVLNGSEGKFGVVKIAEEYSGTDAGNLATYYAGISYLNLGKYNEAISSLEKFKSENETLSTLAIGAIGDAYSQKNQPKEALDFYVKASQAAKNEFTTPRFLMKAGKTALALGNKADALKYTYVQGKVFQQQLNRPEVRERFPTATALTEKYGDDCPISTYSIIESNAVIQRHTGIENRDNEFIRIHIPLVVPEGDVFFECEGAEIDWTDIWAFDNQLIHSAHNYTPFRRLIYLIDIRRSLLGLEVGEKYDVRRQYQVPEFTRGAIPKVLHSHQR